MLAGVYKEMLILEHYVRCFSHDSRSCGGAVCHGRQELRVTVTEEVSEVKDTVFENMSLLSCFL